MSNILIADDEKDVVELIKFMLERDGNTVTEAFDGAQALKEVGKAKPDLIILDVMMPELDGYSVATKLFEDQETKDIPLIILTAKGKMKDLFQSLPNVRAYIEKPFEPALLRTKVRELLNK